MATLGRWTTDATVCLRLRLHREHQVGSAQKVKQHQVGSAQKVKQQSISLGTEFPGGPL